MEDEAVQVAWRALPAPHVRLEVGGQVHEVAATAPAVVRVRGCRPTPVRPPPGAMGGPGAVTFGGLDPGHTYELMVSGPGVARRPVTSVTTLPAPPGRRLDAFATMNDMHLGEPGFGVRNELEELWPLPPGQRPYTWRCIDAAAREALVWGAEALILKGDLTARGLASEFHEIGAMFARSPVPVLATLGNHEFHDTETDGRCILDAYGIHVPREPWAVDRPGLRLVFALTARPDYRSGEIDARQRARIVALVAASPGPAFVVLHHQLQRWRWPMMYPPGIGGGQSRDLLDELRSANPATFVASGHTHRHRRRQHGPLQVVEVGSTKDYPGTWTGYAVHEGGIRQVVRRIESPDVIAWTEATARAVAGLWGRWSPGSLDDRCFTHRWPSRE